MALSGDDVVFTLSPTGFIGGSANAHLRTLVDSNLDNIDTQVNTQDGIQTISKNDNRKSSFARFGGVVPATIPAGSVITRARFRLFASAVDTGAMDNVAVALLTPDGRWNALDTNRFRNLILGEVFGSEIKPRVQQRLLSGGSPINATSITGTDELYWEILGDALFNPTTGIGQVWVISNDLGAGPHSLDTTEVRLRRFGSNASGTLNLILYQCIANDGSDDRPDEVTGALATSNTIAFNSVGTGTTGSTMTFTWGTPHNLVVGNRYVVHVRGNYGANSTNHIGAMLKSELTSSGLPGAYPEGSTGGTVQGFHSANYPWQYQLPFLYEVDDSTIRTTPFGDIAIGSMPAFTSTGVYFSFEPPAFKYLIQEFIDSPGYASANGLVGVTIAPTASTQVGVKRQWDGREFMISWRPRDRYDLV